MADTPDLVAVEALEAFTVTRPYGQFHGDPASKRNKDCMVPRDAVEDLVARGKVRIADDEELRTELRDQYKAVFGKKPFAGWTAEQLMEKLEAAPVAEGNTTGADEGDAAPAA